LLHNMPWSQEETEKLLQMIRKNYTQGMYEIISLSKRMKLEFRPENLKHVQFVEELMKERDWSGINAENFPVLKVLWEDPVVQKIVTNYKERITITHVNYYWEHVSRIMSPNYKPTEEDILRVRMRTSGAYSTLINVENNCFEFFDVGGQKPERAKWDKLLQTHEFACILYFLATDEWDVQDEDLEFNQSKMGISKIIFQEVVTCEEIPKEIPVLLFLNRSDLFATRIKNEASFKSFTASFPEYSGGQNPEEAMNHVIQKFTEEIPPGERILRHYVTNALDRDSMVPVWKTIKQYVMHKAVMEIGL